MLQTRAEMVFLKDVVLMEIEGHMEANNLVLHLITSFILFKEERGG